MKRTNLDRFIRLDDTIQNFALVTHAVPSERVRPQLPSQFELQTFPEGGIEKAWISTSCFCNHEVHWGGLRRPAHDFDQTTFRTYATYKGLVGAYFFGTWVSTPLSWVGQFAVAGRTRLADFDVEINGGSSGYPRYRFTATSRGSEVGFDIEALDAVEPKYPFETGDEHGAFITHRLHGFTKGPLGFHVVGRIHHRRMRPWAGRLNSGRFDYWTEREILFPDEYDDVYSVLVEPSVHFLLYPPRPAL